MKLNHLLILMTLQITGLSQITEQIKSEAKNHVAHSFKLCKYLHQNPELSFNEFETAGRLAEELQNIGFEVTKNVGNGIWRVFNRNVFLGYFNENELRTKEKSVWLKTNLV